MKIGVIWAESPDGVIGLGGAIPWHAPTDLKAFAEVTTGQAIIMGRKTWESLPVKPLAARMNVVVTSNPNWKAPGATAAASLRDALHACRHQLVPTAWVIGGNRLLCEALAIANDVVVTTVNYQGPGDAWAPSPRWSRDYKLVGAVAGREETVKTRERWTRTAAIPHGVVEHYK